LVSPAIAATVVGKWRALAAATVGNSERLSHRQVNDAHVYDARHELPDHTSVSRSWWSRTRSHRRRAEHPYVHRPPVDERLTSRRDDDAMSTTDHGISITEISWVAPPQPNAPPPPR